MQYFKNRVEAGNLIADQLEKKYLGKNNAVVALGDGSVMVAAPIALRLKCVLTMLLTRSITLPRENDVFAAVNQEGEMTYNPKISTGEVDEMQGEYRNFIEQQRMQGLHDINNLFGGGEIIRKGLLRGHNVILVSDGLNGSFELDSAADFLKPLKLESLVITTPLASVPAVDRMHVMADDIYCLNVLGDYMNTDHYYEIHDVPDHSDVVQTLQSIVQKWK